jgi:hypothetical protein
VLNHRDPKTTAGYAYFQTQQRREALTCHGDKVLALGAPHFATHGLRKESVPRACSLRSLPLWGPDLHHHQCAIDIISGVKRSTTSCGRRPSRKWRRASEYPMWHLRSPVAARQSPFPAGLLAANRGRTTG